MLKTTVLIQNKLQKKKTGHALRFIQIQTTEHLHSLAKNEFYNPYYTELLNDCGGRDLTEMNDFNF